MTAKPRTFTPPPAVEEALRNIINMNRNTESDKKERTE